MNKKENKYKNKVRMIITLEQEMKDFLRISSSYLSAFRHKPVTQTDVVNELMMLGLAVCKADPDWQRVLKLIKYDD